MLVYSLHAVRKILNFVGQAKLFLIITYCLYFLSNSPCFHLCKTSDVERDEKNKM